VQQAELDREWMTLREVQEMLSIGRTKAWQLVASGEVPAVKIGRSVRVSRKELEQWLEEQRYLDAAGP
jgi:excisionase family DNA binding protein